MVLLLPSIERNTRGDEVGIDDVLFAITLFRDHLPELGVVNGLSLGFKFVVTH